MSSAQQPRATAKRTASDDHFPPSKKPRLTADADCSICSNASAADLSLIPRTLHLARARAASQQAPLSRTAGMEKLPVELMDQILSQLSRQDILHLRSASNKIDTLTWAYTSKRYFTRLHIPLSAKGNEQVMSFLTLPLSFKAAFTTLELHAGVYIPSGGDDPQPKDAKKRKAKAKKAKKAAAAAAAKAQDATHENQHQASQSASNPISLKERIPPNTDTYSGPLPSARTIKKCLAYLPSLTTITLTHHPNADYHPSRDAHIWTPDHRRASAEAIALLHAISTHAPSHLRTLVFRPTILPPGWDEGLLLLADLRTFTDDRDAMARLASALGRLERFGCSLNTNTLHEVGDEEYASVARLLACMPALRELELGGSRRARRTHPVLLFRSLGDRIPALPHLRALRVCNMRVEEGVWDGLVGRFEELECLVVERCRVYESWQAVGDNQGTVGSWLRRFEGMGEGWEGKGRIKLEGRDPSMVLAVVLRKSGATKKVLK